jgi:ABC-2 type transport system ATP-binding protein
MEHNSDLLIKTIGLTRRFGSEIAVNKLNLAVPVGCVYGFLGPNGAGKTTTIRMMLGLLKPTSGGVQIFGAPLLGNRGEVLTHVSALVESPSLYPHLTGRENLEVTRRLLGLPKAAVDRALDMVEMTTSADKLVRAYSLGMRQRLGLGLALMPQSPLLILDEPTNGLDPAGIAEIRELITELPKQHGITVFLSSHLLNEVEQMATRIGIIHHGRMLFQGTLDELRAERHEQLSLGIDKPDYARQALTQKGWKVLPHSNGHILVEVNGPADVAMINRQLEEQGFNVFHLSLDQPSLEDTFLKLTSE